MSSGALPQSVTRKALRAALGRLRGGAPAEVTGVMARRKALRFLLGGRSRQGTFLGLAAAGLLALLIPLHRAYGDAALPSSTYFLGYGLLLQAALFILAARAVWLSARQDAASGTLDELRLAGLAAPDALLGRWLGLCAAGAGWCLMLLPFLVLAGAFTGAGPERAAGVLLAWFLAAAAGGLCRTLLTSVDRSTAAFGVGPLVLLLQGWFMLRWVLPRIGSGLGPAWSQTLLWLRRADPVTLLPAAAGYLREPWALKAGVALLALGAGALWLRTRNEEIVVRAAAPQNDAAGFFSLRPVREWIVNPRTDRPPEYGREVVFPFERAFGWRLRVNPLAWLCILSLGVILSVPVAILGPELHLAAAALATADASLAAAISALGMAAAFLSEREQRRWVFLRCSPLTMREVLLAKWRAAWLETWPLWAVALVRALLFALTGALPWTAAPVAVLAPPVAAGAAAALTAALCAPSPSLTAAYQRALVLLFTPAVAAVASSWLLPGLSGTGYLSLPHVLFSALLFRPKFAAPTQALAALLVFALAGAGALGLAHWQLRRWPPDA